MKGPSFSVGIGCLIGEMYAAWNTGYSLRTGDFIPGAVSQAAVAAILLANMTYQNREIIQSTLKNYGFKVKTIFNDSLDRIIQIYKHSSTTNIVNPI